MIQIRRSYVSLVYIGVFLVMTLASIEILAVDMMYYLTWFWLITLSITIIRRVISWKYIMIKDIRSRFIWTLKLYDFRLKQ